MMWPQSWSFLPVFATVSVVWYVAFGFRLPSITQSQQKAIKKKHEGQALGISGLVNHGNTCFFNAILQALASCIHLQNWLDVLDVTDWFPSSCEPGRDKDHCSLLTTFKNSIETINQTKGDVLDPFDPQMMLRSLARLGWYIRPEEQDAHELYHVLVSTLEEEMSISTNRRTGLASINDESQLLPYKSPFRGYYASQLFCMGCSKRGPVRYDSFDSISLTLPRVLDPLKPLTLNTLLNQYLGSELLGSVDCDRCSEKLSGKAQSTFIKRLSLGKLPAVLCIHVQRVTWTNEGIQFKRQDAVEFPELLDVGSFMYNHRILEVKNAGVAKKCGSKTLYRLSAVVEHLGTAFSGHFVTYRRGTDLAKWYYTSDTLVKGVERSKVLETAPYMLFYERIL